MNTPSEMGRGMLIEEIGLMNNITLIPLGIHKLAHYTQCVCHSSLPLSLWHSAEQLVNLCSSF